MIFFFPVSINSLNFLFLGFNGLNDCMNALVSLFPIPFNSIYSEANTVPSIPSPI